MNPKTEQRFRDLLLEIEYYNNTINSLSWDMRVCLPPNASEYRGDLMGFLSGKVYDLKTSKEMGDLLAELKSEKIEDFVFDRMVKRADKEYQRLINTPADIFAEFQAHVTKTELVWQEARKKSDYQMVLPYMKKEWELKTKLIEANGFKDDHVTGHMNEWQEGVTRQQIDTLFEDLKKAILPLVQEIKATGKNYNRSNLLGFYPKEQQRAFLHEMLDTVGYNFQCGRMDESAHPYSTPNFRTDSRLTTRFFEDDFTNATISSMHEGGHSIYWQNISPSLDHTLLNVSTSNPVDESQSRFNENIIGRSKEFWEYFTPIAHKHIPATQKFDADFIYKNLNGVNLTPSRLQADELTYNLHVIIRYECEKMLFDGDITYEDLPRVWNAKYQEYMGVTPKNDAEGLLQDMQWYSGYICYFQSYVLGNCYDGHWLNAIKKEVPDMFQQVGKGNFKPAVGWLNKHVHQYGALYTPEEVLFNATGETLSAKHYVDYITKKYRSIYEI